MSDSVRQAIRDYLDKRNETRRRTCRTCHGTYYYPTMVEDQCWLCHNRSNPDRHQGKLEFDVAEMISNSTPKHCPNCNEDFVNGFDGELCDDCTEKQKGVDKAFLTRRAQRMSECGVPEEHRKFTDLKELTGSDAYLKVRDTIRGFLNTGYGIQIWTGGRGLGKTQLMSTSVLKAINRDIAARYIKAQQLVAALKECFSKGKDRPNETKWIAEWSAPHILCIDEWGLAAVGEYIRNAVTNLLDNRYAAKRITLIACNVDPDRVHAAFDEAVISRTEQGGGIIVFRGWPSFREQDRPQVQQPEFF